MPLGFTGNHGCFTTVYQAIDAGLLAKAVVWAATTLGCADQPFNVTNCDCFRWQYLWSKLADFFDMEAGGVQQVELATLMAGKKPVRDRMVAQHGLKPYAYEELANWRFGDLILSLSWDDVPSVVKSRQYGFSEAVDTEAMFLRILADFRVIELSLSRLSNEAARGALMRRDAKT